MTKRTVEAGSERPIESKKVISSRRDFLKMAGLGGVGLWFALQETVHVALAADALLTRMSEVDKNRMLENGDLPPITPEMLMILGGNFSMVGDDERTQIVKTIFGHREEVYEARNRGVSWQGLELLPLAKSKRGGELISNVDLSARTGDLSSYNATKSWYVLESGGWLVTRVTFLGKVTLPLVCRGKTVGESTVAGFTRERGKVLWGVVGCDIFGVDVGSKYVGSDGAIGGLDVEALRTGKEYLVDLHRGDPLDGNENLGGAHEILDFYTPKDSSNTARQIRRDTLFGMLVPSALQEGLGSDYTVVDVARGKIDNRRALHVKHVLEVDNPHVTASQ